MNTCFNLNSEPFTIVQGSLLAIMFRIWDRLFFVYPAPCNHLLLLQDNPITGASKVFIAVPIACCRLPPLRAFLSFAPLSSYFLFFLPSFYPVTYIERLCLTDVPCCPTLLFILLVSHVSLHLSRRSSLSLSSFSSVSLVFLFWCFPPFFRIVSLPLLVPSSLVFLYRRSFFAFFFYLPSFILDLVFFHLSAVFLTFFSCFSP